MKTHKAYQLIRNILKHIEFIFHAGSYGRISNNVKQWRDIQTLGGEKYELWARTIIIFQDFLQGCLWLISNLTNSLWIYCRSGRLDTFDIEIQKTFSLNISVKKKQLQKLKLFYPKVIEDFFENRISGN